MALAADLVVSPSTGTYSTGQTFTATVRVVPGGVSINAVESTLSFDTSQLAVVSVSRDGSVLSLWTSEPAFSNTEGTVTFGGGNPSAFSATSNLLDITFRVLGTGDTTITLADDSSVLANDGSATNIFASATGGTYSLAVAAEPETTPEPTPTPVTNPTPTPTPAADDAIIFGDPPQAPEVGSAIFLDSDVWYNNTEGTFTWTLPFDVTEIAFEVSDDPENVPYENEAAVTDNPTEEFLITAESVTDGVQYISVAFANQVGWGEVTNRPLKIDTTPPELFEVEVQQGATADSFPTLVFTAEDVTSGIEDYQMVINGGEPVTITPAQSARGYLLKDLEDGTYSVYVTARDQAGNKREVSTAVKVQAGWTKPVVEEEETTIWDYLTGVNILIFFLFVTIILLVIYIWYNNKQLRMKDEKLRRETREIQDQMEKIFSALQDEIYDQVSHITKRKRLSQKEKETIDCIIQALEVSETLIEKEISDVKAILK